MNQATDTKAPAQQADEAAALPCEVGDPEMWFSPDPTERFEAARACRTECPLAARGACLELALKMEGHTPGRYRYGIFGGYTPEERYQIWKQRDEDAAAEAEKARQAELLGATA